MRRSHASKHAYPRMFCLVSVRMVLFSMAQSTLRLSSSSSSSRSTLLPTDASSWAFICTRNPVTGSLHQLGEPQRHQQRTSFMSRRHSFRISSWRKAMAARSIAMEHASDAMYSIWRRCCSNPRRSSTISFCSHTRQG